MPYGAHETMEMHEILMEKINAITHFNLYAKEAKNPQLLDMIIRHQQEEVRHYNEVLSYTRGNNNFSPIPSNTDIRGINRQQVQYGVNNQQQLGPKADASMDDAEIAMAMLICHKNMARSATWATLECADPNLRRTLLNGAATCANQAYEVFLLMNEQGVYPVPAINTQMAETFLRRYQPAGQELEAQYFGQYGQNRGYDRGQPGQNLNYAGQAGQNTAYGAGAGNMGQFMQNGAYAGQPMQNGGYAGQSMQNAGYGGQSMQNGGYGGQSMQNAGYGGQSMQNMGSMGYGAGQFDQNMYGAQSGQSSGYNAQTGQSSGLSAPSGQSSGQSGQSAQSGQSSAYTAQSEQNAGSTGNSLGSGTNSGSMSNSAGGASLGSSLNTGSKDSVLYGNEGRSNGSAGMNNDTSNSAYGSSNMHGNLPQ